MMSYFALVGRLEHTDTKEFPRSNTAKYSFQLESRRKRKSGEPLIFELQAWNENGEKAVKNHGGEVIVEGFLGSWTTDKGYHIPQLIIQECRRLGVLEPGGGSGWQQEGQGEPDGNRAPPDGNRDGNKRSQNMNDDDFHDDDIPF